MAYTITQQAPQETTVSLRTAWSVRLTITSSDDQMFPPEIFVYQAETPADPNTRGWFTVVATPAQLLEYPVGAPTIESGDVQQPYYRLSTVELVSRNASDIDLLVRQIYAEVDLLYLNLKALDLLSTPTILLPPVHAAYTTWPGSALLGPYLVFGVPPFNEAVSARVVFTSREGDGQVEFTSAPGADGQVLIVSTTEWTFRIPEQPLHLTAGLWDWQLLVTDSLGEEIETFTGTIQGLY